jgi:hypothetical protein
MAYLMETPTTSTPSASAEKEERLKPFEEAINARRGHHGQGAGRLRPEVRPQHHQQFIGLRPVRSQHG